MKVPEKPITSLLLRFGILSAIVAFVIPFFAMMILSADVVNEVPKFVKQLARLYHRLHFE